MGSISIVASYQEFNVLRGFLTLKCSIELGGLFHETNRDTCKLVRTLTTIKNITSYIIY